MTPLLEQFLLESRELIQGIGEKLLLLENAPCDADLMNELFRLVHTLKGNSGLFEYPEMTRVLHAGEDLLDVVRHGKIAYSQALADELLDAMDFVGVMCEEIKSKGCVGASCYTDSTRLALGLRMLIPTLVLANPGCDSASLAPTPPELPLPDFSDIPESLRMEAYRRSQKGEPLHWITYTPGEECFFQGDDPLFSVRQTPELLWGGIALREPWPPLVELNTYRCVLDYHLLALATVEALAEHYRYVPDQVRILAVEPQWLIVPQGDPNGGPVYADFVADALRRLEAGDLGALKQAALTLQELSNPELWFSSALRWLLVLLSCGADSHKRVRPLIESLRGLTPPDWSIACASLKEAFPPTKPLPTRPSEEEEAAALESVFAAQRQILTLEEHPDRTIERLKAVTDVLINCCKAIGDPKGQKEVEAAFEQALSASDRAPLLAWLDAKRGGLPTTSWTSPAPSEAKAPEEALVSASQQPAAAGSPPRFGRRAEDSLSGPIKVDQAKVDCLMNLIGEMVVAKNALPYLAQRAEVKHGVRELAREIKAQYAVINRIAEEMQDAIMQVRMMPVSFVFQRFPRLVRDISRKLGKEVRLVLEGEDTEADKNIIESLADPLIHIVRNSLDHGLETPDVRRASGKNPTGTLTIRATQETDRVLIDIIDDGKGIDPTVIKRKAYEKGVIDEQALERISDRDALNLVFVAGFSTVEVVSDLSGRGVGMDVVRSAVEKVNGAILLESEVGKGAHIRISLPLSMAVTKVMLVESDGQTFGVPMEYVMETVRVPRSAIHLIKRSQTTVLRGQIVPLKALNALLELPAAPKANADEELAVLVVRVGNEVVGLLVDDFHETTDIIQKPLTGVLSSLTAYSGSALMGDGSVLMVLNVKEMV